MTSPAAKALNLGLESKESYAAYNTGRFGLTRRCRALDMPAELSFETEGRPFFVTEDGKGKAMAELFG